MEAFYDSRLTPSSDGKIQQLYVQRGCLTTIPGFFLFSYYRSCKV